MQLHRIFRKSLLGRRIRTEDSSQRRRPLDCCQNHLWCCSHPTRQVYDYLLENYRNLKFSPPVSANDSSTPKIPNEFSGKSTVLFQQTALALSHSRPFPKCGKKTISPLSSENGNAAVWKRKSIENSPPALNKKRVFSDPLFSISRFLRLRGIRYHMRSYPADFR